MYKLIKEASIKVANKSELSFLKNDIESILKEETPFNQKEIVEKLERALVNANYAGDYKAGELSFIIKYYLEDYDVTSQLEDFINSLQ